MTREARSATGRLWQVAGLVVLAPLCAEYLAAYADSTGDVEELLLGLLILSPLYGAPALLIRETARRARLGWRGMILMAAAFGLLQAGAVDQSLFSESYLGIESWEASRGPTLIEPLGFGAYYAQLFIIGHVIYSICAPVALMEGLRPGQHHQLWLGRVGLAVTTVLYVAASVLVLADHLINESSHASPAQVIGTLLFVFILVAAAFRFGRRTPARTHRSAVSAKVGFIASLAGATVVTAMPETWFGVAIALSVLGLGSVALLVASRASDWGIRHHVAVAAGALVSRGVLAFTYFPILGDVAPTAKYVHNAVLLGIVLVVSTYAVIRVRRYETRTQHENTFA